MSQPLSPELPSIADLSEAQVRGAACVYCGVVLDSGTAVDLGERRGRRAGAAFSWFPRACLRHGAT
jgi:hypothetical protein